MPGDCPGGRFVVVMALGLLGLLPLCITVLLIRWAILQVGGGER